MEIGQMLIGVVIFSMVAIGFTALFVDVNVSGNYLVPVPMNNMTTFSKTVTSINSTLKDIQSSFAADTPNSPYQNPLLAPYTSVRLLLGVPSMMTGIVQDVATIGVTSQGSIFPWWLTAGIITIIGIIVVFAVIAALLGKAP
jgi:beta-lactamase regulating signal transducer with metallopeptidase domain